MEMGPILAAIYAFPVLILFLLSIRLWRWLPVGGFSGRRYLVLLWLALLHQFVVSNFMDMIRHHPFGTTLWWLGIALIANVIHVASRRAEVLGPMGHQHAEIAAEGEATDGSLVRARRLPYRRNGSLALAPRFPGGR